MADRDTGIAGSSAASLAMTLTMAELRTFLNSPAPVVAEALAALAFVAACLFIL